ncbi:MAG: GFA family protein [Anaerolineae bacterium]
MITGSCHCGKVKWKFDETPESATACNCTVCRRYGVLWGYDYDGEKIHVSGPTQVYIRGKTTGFHFCPTCGCVAYWRALEPNDQKQWRIAVNMRLIDDPGKIEHLLIDHFDGLDTFTDLPRDGKCVRDYWF